MIFRLYFISNFCCLKNPKAVYSKNPDFTFCFQHTLVTWVPCFVLWIVAPLWIYMLTRTTPNKIRVSWILVTKTVTPTAYKQLDNFFCMHALFFFKLKVNLCALIGIEVINVVRAYGKFEQTVYYLTPAILISTYVNEFIFFIFSSISN